MIFIDRNGERAAAVNDALVGNDYVTKLERAVSEIVGKTAVAVSSFDSALHTALFLCGVGFGDYVFVPTYTFYSYVAPVVGVGGIPVFIDCDPVTRCVSHGALEQAFIWAELQDKPPKAVIIDNAFGSVADYDVLTPLCKAYCTPSVELTHGLCGDYNGRPCGANCDYGVIGLGTDGGVIVCGDEQKTAREFCRYEYSDGISFDYRLNNFSASVACSLIPVERKLSSRGRANLAALCEVADNVIPPVDGDSGRFALVRTGNVAGIRAARFEVKTPPPVHTLERYSSCTYFEHEKGYSVSDWYSDCALIGMDISPLRRAKLVRLIQN